MASFKPYYTLWPLLGAHNLVGISSDKEEGTVLVTLGPNTVVKHKLTDQKPLKSWSTRQSNPLTCQCVYDSHNEKYVGILNHKHLCEWSENEANLEDIKKKTFTTSIHAIHTLNGRSAVAVFSNGFTENLDAAIKNRKEEKLGLLQENEALVKSYLECVKDQAIIVLFTSSKVHCVRLSKDGTPEGNLSFSPSKEKSNTILGRTVINDGNNINILILWSDGELVQYSEQGTVTFTHTVSGLSFSSPVALVKLDPTHMAIYGADSSDEGALLLLFDLKFGMTVASRRLKFFCNPPHLYCSPDNNVLLLCIGQNLVVVPYILQPSLLWNLMNKNQLCETKGKPEVVSWDATKVVSTTAKSAPRPSPLVFGKPSLTQLAETLWNSNTSHCRLFDELLPPLKEDGDLDGICLLVSRVKDLPERWQADLLNFTLEQPQFQRSGGCIDGKEARQLAILLSIPYSDVILLNHLRKKLTTEATIRLLEHLAKLLQETQWQPSNKRTNEGNRWGNGAANAESGPDVNRIIDWISLILDAHHNELLVAGADPQVQDLINGLRRLVRERYEFLDCLGQSEALIRLLQRNKKPPTNRRKDWYAIEVVRLL